MLAKADKAAHESASAADHVCGGMPASMGNVQAAFVLAGRYSGVEPLLCRCGYRIAKRTFDLIASALALVILFIPGLLLSAAICIKSPGASPIYVQTRVGRVRKDGSYQLFRMLKFRSMVPEADKMLDAVRDKNDSDEPLFKMKDDPRVIPGIGSFMRKHSLDELPQLINVFLGQMSLIGPRPALPGEVLHYNSYAQRRLAIKPGCGGLWQVGTRSDASFKEMVALDLLYIEHRSLGYDASLMLKTIKAMMVGKGAY